MIEPLPSLYDSVIGLRVVRHFENRPVDPDVLTAILEAARWTGSSKNRQSWHFVVLESRDRLAEVATAGDYTVPLLNAALGIVLVRQPDGYEFDIGRVAQNIMLAAAALGVGSCPVTLHREDLAKRILGVPDDHGARYAIALGYPDVDAERAARSQRRSPMSGRLPLDDLVSRERFGG